MQNDQAGGSDVAEDPLYCPNVVQWVISLNQILLKQSEKNINQVYLLKKELFSAQVIMAFGLVIFHSIVFKYYLVWCYFHINSMPIFMWMYLS